MARRFVRVRALAAVIAEGHDEVAVGNGEENRETKYENEIRSDGIQPSEDVQETDQREAGDEPRAERCEQAIDHVEEKTREGRYVHQREILASVNRVEIVE